MHIELPEIIVDAEHVTLRARVRLQKRGTVVPEHLWFRYARQHESLVSREIAPFVVALSSLASVFREPIEVEGSICERLRVGLEEYWTIFNRWLPDTYSPVLVACNGPVEDVQASHACQAGHACGTAFSGGVDSFFTLYRHLQDRERYPSHVVRYALFVHGFDIPLTDERSYRTSFEAYEPVLAGHGVTLVGVTTNLREFVGRADWNMSHGSALCGTAMTLSPVLRRFFVPSSKSYGTLEPWGSDPVIDALLSTDSFQVIHDGAAYTRFEKLQAMQSWKTIRPLLRTCYEAIDGLRNCGRCRNCRRTMFVLAALGELDKFETFPPVTSPAQFRWARWDTPHERLVAQQSIEHAAGNGRVSIAMAGRVAMKRSQVLAVKRRLMELWRRPAR